MSICVSELLEYQQSLESLGKKVVKSQHWCEWISKIPLHGWRASKNQFLIITTLLALAIFSPVFQIWWIKKGPEPKNLLKQKINVFISINYAKEFLNSLRTSVVFLELFSRASNGCRYSRSWNFQLKICLCSVFQHAEFKFHGCSWIWDNGFALNWIDTT